METHNVAQAGQQITTILLQAPECRDTGVSYHE